MRIMKTVCPDCDGGTLECENCEGSGDCGCSKCDASHECGLCEGNGEYDCEKCKGSGMVIWTGQGQEGLEFAEEAVCSCGRPAQAIIKEEELCPLCEAGWVLERVLSC